MPGGFASSGPLSYGPETRYKNSENFIGSKIDARRAFAPSDPLVTGLKLDTRSFHSSTKVEITYLE